MFFKYWLRKKFKFFLTLLGFAGGVLLFLTLGAVGDHFHDLSRNLKTVFFNKIFIGEKPTFWGGAGVLPGELWPRIEQTPGVEKVIPLLVERLRAEQLFALGLPETMIGFPLDDFQALFGRLEMKAGSYPALGLPGGVWLGEELSLQLSAGVGGQVNLRGRDFKVYGIFSGTSGLLERSAVLNLPDLASLLYREDLYTAFAVIPKPGVSPEELGSRIKKFNHFMLFTPGQLKREIQKTFKLWDALFLVCTLLAFLGSGLLLLVSFSLTFRERVFEIGLKKAIGSPDSLLFREFLAEGLLIAVLGLALGSLGAYWLIKWLDNYFKAGGFSLFQLSWGLWLKALAFYLGLSLLLSGGFALRALKLSPAEALKKC